jgi:hypothetical protein
MSSKFGENFRREESEQLNYDEVAFYYFGLAMLFITLVPTTYFLVIRPMFQGQMVINTSIKNCQCSICKARMKRRQAIYRFAFIDRWLLLRAVFVAILWYFCYLCYKEVKDL